MTTESTRPADTDAEFTQRIRTRRRRAKQRAYERRRFATEPAYRASVQAIIDEAAQYKEFPTCDCALVYDYDKRIAYTSGPLRAYDFDGAWTYESQAAAMAALSEWDGVGDPPGRWIRHTPSNRRREYDGLRLKREYVHP